MTPETSATATPGAVIVAAPRLRNAMSSASGAHSRKLLAFAATGSGEVRPAME
jgi:hypothetical protein